MIYFKKFEEIIPISSEKKWTEKNNREIKPSWKDLKDKRIAVSQYHFNKVTEYMENKHFCILVGNKDTGKTWLTYAVGYELVNQDKQVKFITVDGNFNCKDAWANIKKLEYLNKNDPEMYLIIDDCHLEHKESQEFFQNILDEDEENLRFLFTMRKIGKTLLEDEEPVDTFYKEGKKRGCIVHLSPDKKSKEHVKNIIKKFIQLHEIKYPISEDELENIVKIWGNDLFWVKLRLDSWNYNENQKLSEITNDQVYESVMSDRGEIKLSLPDRQKLLIPLSILCRYESLAAFEFANFIQDNRQVLKTMRKEGIINSFTKEQKEFVTISENLANTILLTISARNPSFNETNMTIHVLKNYLKSNPPNWYEVFHSIYLTRKTEESDFSKNVLASIWKDADILNIVKENVQGMPLKKMILLIDCLLWTEGLNYSMKSQSACEIRSCYLESKNQYLQNNLKNSSATSIVEQLYLFSRIDNPNKILEGLDISDYEHIIDLSTITSIRRLFDTFKRKKLSNASKMLANALPEANIGRLVSLENASLFRLSGLIGYLMQIDASTAEKFVEKLSEFDLSKLFLRKDSIAETKGETKIRTINYFLSMKISVYPLYRKKIVNNIHNETWDRLFESASFEESYWLLWNIYVTNPNIAKMIIQKGKGDLLLKKCIQEKKELFLPLIGILYISDFIILNVKFETDFMIINQTLAKIKQENKPSLYILSLIALKVKLLPKQFEKINKQSGINLINFIRDSKNSQNKEALINLIENYLN